MKFKTKAENNNVKIQSELFALKKEMKEISYRDISKLIINNYIEKYSSKLKKEKIQKLVKFLFDKKINKIN